MMDRKHLQYCLNQIEIKLNWGESQLWKESEFLHLSDIISDETDISISPHTLKRLFGKIKYKNHYNPQRATRDALAKFVGYNDWNGFTAHYDDNIEKNPQTENQLTWNSKNLKISIFIILGLVIIVLIAPFLFGNLKNKLGHSKLTTFNTSDSVGYVPHTISIKYDMKRISDNSYIDLATTHPINGPEKIDLTKSTATYNYTYQIPGYYPMNIVSSDQKLAVRNILVLSKGWDSYFYLETKPGPWLSSQIPAQEHDGNLYYSPEYLASKGFDINSVFYINNRLFKKFGIDGDNFEMEVRFQNSKETGGITCFDFLTNIYCEKNLTNITLMEKGCSSYSEIKVGDTEILGSEENLSSLTFDADRWNNLDVKIKDHKVQISINGDLIYSTDYDGSNGNIVGIEHKFKGTGKLDYVRLKDLGTQNEFFDNFE